MKNDYDARKVDYTLIHGETDEIYTKFISHLKLNTDVKLLDLGGGYGSLLLQITKNIPGVSFQYHLVDGSRKQIEKATDILSSDKLSGAENVVKTFIHKNAGRLLLPTNWFDHIICKMFIHEVPANQKTLMYKLLYEWLKPEGSVLFWMPELDEESYDLYTGIIKKKDELAGFKSLAENRHFQLNTAFVKQLNESGFNKVEKLFEFDYNLNTVLRLNQEFDNDEAKLLVLNNYILELASQFGEARMKQFDLRATGNNINLRFKRAVYRAVKHD
jgi:ubiquinone/menaquinone biosynthesis C-methylase UbiE